jgi:single-strand DNA-binding protein
MMNKVIIIGHVGKDPEVRSAPSGTAVCNFNVATSESFKDKAGVKQERTTWHMCVAWGRLAETIGKYVTKGMLIMVEGSIQNTQYEDKDGNKRFKSEIKAENVQFLSRSNKEQKKDEQDYPGNHPTDDTGGW